MWSIEDVDRWGLSLFLVLYVGGNIITWIESFECSLVYLCCVLGGVQRAGAHRDAAKTVPNIYVAA